MLKQPQVAAFGRREMGRRMKRSSRAAGAAADARAAAAAADEGARADVVDCGCSSSERGGGSDGDVVPQAHEEAEPSRCMVQEPLPTADGFDDSVVKGDEDWAQRTAEERVSAAGPAPAASNRFTPLTALRTLLQGVTVNPAEHRWDEHNFIAAESVAELEAKWVEWAGTAAGDEGQVLPRGGLDSWQGFAYDIREAKAEELECKTQSGHQS